MSEMDCEIVYLSAIALSDGEQAPKSPVQIEQHLANCPDCRLQVGQIRELIDLLDAQTRQRHSVDVWSAVNERLVETERVQNKIPSKGAFVILALLLTAYKLFEIIPDRDFGFAFRLLPIVIVIGAFLLTKVNPFRIDTEVHA